MTLYPHCIYEVVKQCRLLAGLDLIGSEGSSFGVQSLQPSLKNLKFGRVSSTLF